MPCVFSTPIYSIFDIGILEKGQICFPSILWLLESTLDVFHSPCLYTVPAVELALRTFSLLNWFAGIYATVGNEEKVRYLMDTFSLPRNRILYSRSSSFVEDIMQETNDQSFDLILNSLSGELLHATWKCIAPFGKMVEIGKRDFIGSGKLDMTPFLDNRS
ncbi:hypothetical protein N7447_010149 [Penicillium robsamsonii]|uniref:uncharacterized protein n=1 Tax=Penicillium robsamsonii TaxID=1792511 RepID=UPI0025471A62|nr:uncharacterized protein N7447_010149 [Penicillium robsamsonii]KAJ5813126.1 hypothetical protein N7447_010149 [Penicillium robsamsonii]